MDNDQRQPDRAYLSADLWLPKSKINVVAIKQSLEVYPTVQSNYAKAGVRLWRETKLHLVVPRHFIAEKDFSRWDFPFVDQRPTKFPHVLMKHRVIPRDKSQAEAISALAQASSGILNLACGKGKTTVALTAIVEIQQPAIIVVNNRSLMMQWQEMIRKHWIYRGPIGAVQQNVFDWKHPITIAMIHTLAKKAEDWPIDFRKFFGVAVFDEVHHLSAPLFVRSANLFFGRRWGLTATPQRADGLEVAFHYHLGPIIYSDMEQSLIPETWFIQTGVKPKSEEEAHYLFDDRSGQENLSRIRGWLGTHVRRNDLILREVQKARRSKRKVLAITHSRKHAEILHKAYKGSGLCVGTMDAAQRLKMVQEKGITFATAQLAGEALDAPGLDTLFILTPFGDHNAMQQCLGRIQRPHPKKKRPLAIVFEDDIGYCRGLCGKLKQFLRKNKYPIRKVSKEAI